MRWQYRMQEISGMHPEPQVPKENNDDDKGDS